MHRLGTRKRYRSTVWQPSEHDTGLVDLLQYSFQQRQLPLQFRLRRAVRLPRDFIFKAALLASEEFCCLLVCSSSPESKRKSRAITLFSNSLYCRGSCSNKTFASSFSSSVSKWNCMALSSNRETASETLYINWMPVTLELSVTKITERHNSPKSTNTEVRTSFGRPTPAVNGVLHF